MTQASITRDAFVDPRRSTLDPDEAVLALGRALDKAPREGLSRFSLRVNRAPLTALLRAFEDREAVLFEPPRGPCIAGVGVAAVLRASGQDRFATLVRDAQALFPSITLVGETDVTSEGPQLVGGAAFRPGPAAPEWQAFGEACFVLPRLSYTELNGRAQLHLVADAGADRDELEDSVREAMSALRTPLRSRSAPRALLEEHLEPGIWAKELASIRAAIRGGGLAKAVLARRSLLRFDGAPSDVKVLEALGARHPSCTRFALRLGDSTFLGATPERLVRREGSQVRSEALAGTVAPGHAAELLASQKEGGEHRLVVSAIEAALRPLCVELEQDPEPRLRKLADVLHMETRFRGRLSGAQHVLELVDALHPTPAVGGTPTDAALALLSEVEGTSRGFYSGPFGAFDAAGDGTFVVALRSGLLQGDRAYVYAGAGIVEGSQAAAEYAETELKMRAVLAALAADAGEGGRA